MASATREEQSRSRRPATTLEGRENQVISMAVDLAERQIADGTASSQIITHYLKMGSTRERLEQEKMARELELMQAKIEALESNKRVEELYAEAIQAMRIYAGQDVSDDDNDY